MKKIRLVKWDKKNNGTSCNSCDALYICKKSLTFTPYVANELNLNGEELEQLIRDRNKCGTNYFIFKVPFFRAKNKRRF